MPKKDQAAVALANKRWSKVSKRQRKAHGKRLSAARNAALSDEEKSAIARKGGLAKAAKAAKASDA